MFFLFSHYICVLLYIDHLTTCYTQCKFSQGSNIRQLKCENKTKHGGSSLNISHSVNIKQPHCRPRCKNIQNIYVILTHYVQ